MRGLVFLMVLISIASAVAVIWVRHENRVTNTRLEAQFELRDELNIEWHRLRVERAAVSRVDHLETWAVNEKSLVRPTEHVVFVLPKTPAAKIERSLEQ